jgi:hypothetical protein
MKDATGLRKSARERVACGRRETGMNDVDRSRRERTGVPEVVLALGKPDDALVEAVALLLESHPVLVTKCNAGQIALLEDEFRGEVERKGRFSGTLVLSNGESPAAADRRVAVISAGAADLPVAEEATISSGYLGLDVSEVRDCGIAGLHRASRAAESVGRTGADAVIVVAGMEGALASVIASLVDRPVIAVPTSVGYGTGAGGFAAMLAMLNSCVPGVVAVNIDNGFGAAAAARRILGRSRAGNRQ